LTQTIQQQQLKKRWEHGFGKEERDGEEKEEETGGIVKRGSIPEIKE